MKTPSRSKLGNIHHAAKPAAMAGLQARKSRSKSDVFDFLTPVKYQLVPIRMNLDHRNRVCKLNAQSVRTHSVEKRDKNFGRSLIYMDIQNKAKRARNLSCKN